MRQVFKKENGIFIFTDWVIIENGQEIPEGYEEIPSDMEGKYKEDGMLFVKSLDEQKAEKIAELNNKCEAEIINGFTSATTGYFYAFSVYDQLNFTQQYSLLIGDPAITSVDWKTEDAGVINHTRAQFITIASLEAVAHKRNMIGKYWAFKALVEAAVTKEEVDAIVW